MLIKRRENNPNWKGGRHISSHGYVKILVDKDHHLADGSNYAYEHRIVAEQILGRRLRKGETIHHLDNCRRNNDPTNISIKISRGRHLYEHRTAEKGRQKPGENNSLIVCLCGCGTLFLKYDNSGRSRKYISGHNMNHLEGTHYGRRKMVGC